MTTGNYILDQGDEGQARLRQLRMFDRESIGYLEALTTVEGSRVLDVGAGAGSMTDWFCTQVGRDGSVVAIDLDTQNVERLDHPNLEIRRADVVSHALEQEGFDLVFARAVLEHIPEREAVLDKLVAALKPGGWILTMDLDLPGRQFDRATPPMLAARWQWIMATAVAGQAARGHEGDCGTRAPRRFHARGLQNVGAEGRQSYYEGGSELASWYRRASMITMPPLVAEGILTQAELEDGLATYDDPALAVWDSPRVYAWGQKPV